MNKKCKICESNNLDFFAHTAKCKRCGVLLNYPYPAKIREEEYKSKSYSTKDIANIQEYILKFYLGSGERNHFNFTSMVKFALNDNDRFKDLKILDYGGGGGQFSLILQSLFPKAKSYIVDMNNHRLLNKYKPINNQIKFEDFSEDKTKFDVIFLNDVFEHVSSPVEVLSLLNKKLSVGGRIFIDTPCSFWLYPFTKFISKRLYKKLLKGTVDSDHQQIWTYKSFKISVERAGFKISKYKRITEFTQPAKYYLKFMNIRNRILIFIGEIFYKLAPYIARNKIISVIKSEKIQD